MASPNKPQLGIDEYYVRCPYDLSHLVTQLNETMHLQKCRRNYKKEQELKRKNGGCPDADPMVVCDLDATHHVRKSELKSHRKICPSLLTLAGHNTCHADKAFIKRTKKYRARIEKEKKSKLLNPGVDDDDWEKDVECEGPGGGYDPRLKMEQLPVITQGLVSPSEKKELLQMEHQIREKNMKKEMASKKRDFSYAGED